MYRDFTVLDARSIMSVLAAVIPEAKSLSRAGKLRLIQALAEDLAGDESIAVEPDRSYAVWSPESAFSAAEVILRMLSSKSHSQAGLSSNFSSSSETPSSARRA